MCSARIVLLVSISLYTLSGGQYINRNFTILSDSTIVILTDTISLYDIKIIEGYLSSKNKSDLPKYRRNAHLGLLAGLAAMAIGFNQPQPTYGQPLTGRSALIFVGAMEIGFGGALMVHSAVRSRKIIRKFDMSKKWEILIHPSGDQQG